MGVDELLPLSDYYQVDVIKNECAALLLHLDPSIDRLVQARLHNLDAQYDRCVKLIAAQAHKFDLTSLRRHPEVLMDVQSKMSEISSLRLGWASWFRHMREGVVDIIL